MGEEGWVCQCGEPLHEYQGGRGPIAATVADAWHYEAGGEFSHDVLVLSEDGAEVLDIYDGKCRAMGKIQPKSGGQA